MSGAFGRQIQYTQPPSGRLEAHADNLSDAGFHMSPAISIEQTAQQMALDMENHGAQAVLSEDQLASFLSPVGQLTLRLWEFNRSQNNQQIYEAIQANTQLTNVLGARSELGAACASEEARRDQATTISNMMMATCG